MVQQNSLCFPCLEKVGTKFRFPCAVATLQDRLKMSHVGLCGGVHNVQTDDYRFPLGSVYLLFGLRSWSRSRAVQVIVFNL